MTVDVAPKPMNSFSSIARAMREDGVQFFVSSIDFKIDFLVSRMDPDQSYIGRNAIPMNPKFLPNAFHELMIKKMLEERNVVAVSTKAKWDYQIRKYFLDKYEYFSVQ